MRMPKSHYFLMMTDLRSYATADEKKFIEDLIKDGVLGPEHVHMLLKSDESKRADPQSNRQMMKTAIDDMLALTARSMLSEELLCVIEEDSEQINAI